MRVGSVATHARLLVQAARAWCSGACRYGERSRCSSTWRHQQGARPSRERRGAAAAGAAAVAAAAALLQLPCCKRAPGPQPVRARQAEHGSLGAPIYLWDVHARAGAVEPPAMVRALRGVRRGAGAGAGGLFPERVYGRAAGAQAGGSGGLRTSGDRAPNSTQCRGARATCPQAAGSTDSQQPPPSAPHLQAVPPTRPAASSPQARPQAQLSLRPPRAPHLQAVSHDLALAQRRQAVRAHVGLARPAAGLGAVPEDVAAAADRDRVRPGGMHMRLRKVERGTLCPFSSLPVSGQAAPPALTPAGGPCRAQRGCGPSPSDSRPSAPSKRPRPCAPPAADHPRWIRGGHEAAAGAWVAGPRKAGSLIQKHSAPAMVQVVLHRHRVPLARP